ncbi:MAG: ABC transporter substrate-binding protein [Spirochaetaceae bacterium]|nr:ABC transporter substrate-binding protein [Spirochaetaceae bacterium]
MPSNIFSFFLKYIFSFGLVFLFISCGASQKSAETPVPETMDFTPLETVQRLAEENKHLASVVRDNTSTYPVEIRSILNRGSIRFAMLALDQKPFFYRDPESGELIGLDVEIGYEIANRLRVRAIFDRESQSFNDVVLQVMNKKADVALSKLSMTTQRAEQIRYTNPYVSFRQSLLVNRLEFAKIGTEEQLPHFIRNYNGSLGVIKNSSYMNFALLNFPTAKVQTFDSWEQTVEALFSGKVLGIYRDEGEILIINATRKDASILMKPVFINDKRDPIAMAVSADAPLLQEWLNVFLSEYLLQKRGELTPSRIIARHFAEENK